MSIRLTLLLETFNILDHISTDKSLKPLGAFEGNAANRKYKKTMSDWKLLVE